MNSSTATSTKAPTAPAFVEPWTAIVITERTVMAHRRNRAVSVVPPAIAGDPVAFLDIASALFAKHGEGTLITRHVPGPWHDNGDGRPLIEQLRTLQGLANRGGWRSTDAGHKSGWITFTHKDGKAPVHLGVLTALDPAAVPLFDLGWPPEQIARQLAEYAAATGVAYRATPGVAGVALIRGYHENKPVRAGAEREVPMWMWDRAPDDIHTPGDIVWKRAMLPEEKKRRHVVAFDVNKQYLAAMAAVPLSWDFPQPTGAREFDPTAAGLWHIVAPRGSELLGRTDGGPPLPTVLNPTHISSTRSCWVATPVLAYLHELGTPAEVLDSITAPAVRREFPNGVAWPGSGRWLRNPAERLRDAIAQHGRPVGHKRDCGCPSCRMAGTLKRTANEAIGLMATARTRIRRLDVHHSVRDHARVSELRKIYRAAAAGFHPFRVAHDCVYYALDDPEPPAELVDALGAVTHGQIGRFKHEKEKSTTMAAYVAEQRKRDQERRARHAR
jgi:hypothetical protein